MKLTILLIAVIWAAVTPAMADVCGDQPHDLPVESQESIRADAEGKAKLAFRMLGDANLKGTLDASRLELRQKYNNIDRSAHDKQ